MNICCDSDCTNPDCPGLNGNYCCKGPGCTLHVPRARHTDPETSHLAAESVRDLTNKQFAVLICLRACGPVLDEELINAYEEAVRRGVMPVQSESGIRTRRCELVVAGHAKEVNRRPNSRGRLATVWQAL